MTSATYFVVLAFAPDEDGKLIAEEGIEALSAFLAQRGARTILTKKVGAVAFS